MVAPAEVGRRRSGQDTAGVLREVLVDEQPGALDVDDAHPGPVATGLGDGPVGIDPGRGGSQVALAPGEVRGRRGCGRPVRGLDRRRLGGWLDVGGADQWVGEKPAGQGVQAIVVGAHAVERRHLRAAAGVQGAGQDRLLGSEQRGHPCAFLLEDGGQPAGVRGGRAGPVRPHPQPGGLLGDDDQLPLRTLTGRSVRASCSRSRHASSPSVVALTGREHVGPDRIHPALWSPSGVGPMMGVCRLP